MRLTVGQLGVKVDRFYKNDEEALKWKEQEREVKLIGMERWEEKDVLKVGLNSGEAIFKLERAIEQ